jgi:pimeloyl-ACP methyl ester carboxylesterase
MKSKIFYRTEIVDGLSIFYREAGNREHPVLLLLHGFPSSSHMFRNLIAELSDSFYIIAPDYPGFGQSSSPGVKEFIYTFDHLSLIIERFIDQLQLRDITVYMQDYGGPVGMRIASRNPGLFTALIIQNANAYTEGLGSLLQPLTLYAQDPTAENEKEVRFFLSLEATRWQYTHGAADAAAIDPDSYITDQYYLDRPGNDEIQLALFRDYGNNYPRYSEWQQYLRTATPATLVIWGKNDAMFIAAGADAYKKDLPDADVIQIEGGHCLLEEHYHDVAALIRPFMQARIAEK